MSSKRTFLGIIGVYALFVLPGCHPATPVALAGPQRPAGGDTELELQKRAASWPHADEVTVLSLVAHYSAARRDREAHDFFRQQAAAHPGRGLYLALAAMYRTRMAGEVPFWKRIGWVNGAIGMLDQAVAVDPGLSRVFRGLVLAQLPARFGQAQRAAEELRWLLDGADSPLHPDRITLTAAHGLRRAAWQALARALHTLERPGEAATALARSGAPSLEADVPLLATPWSVTAADGFRFGPPRVWSPQPGVFVASGHDFADIAFIATDAGVVAIDAGTTPDTARRAWQAVSAKLPGQTIRTVIMTHGHWDHAGGLVAYQGPGVEVIAHARFPQVVARGAARDAPFRYFFGRGFDQAALAAAKATRLIDERTTLRIGGRTLVLHPAPAAETEDALMIELPDTGLVFAGDALMPYVGAPFAAEGSPEGVVDAIEQLGRMGARRLVHGHAPLTDLYTAEALPQLGVALRELRARVLQGIARNQSAAGLRASAWLPDSLARAPAAVQPYLVMRENFVARLQRDRTGYWQPDGAGLQTHTRDQWAAALDLLAGGDEGRFRKAAEALLGRGELGLALEVTDAGLLAHPRSQTLRDLRGQALSRLREKNQGTSPFKFIVYSELAGAELPPIGASASAERDDLIRE
jgi:glyoxylase-like metal-dependent hydrolase (beta-lactamase superfamily II)